jgi:hypothetical protein
MVGRYLGGDGHGILEVISRYSIGETKKITKNMSGNPLKFEQVISQIKV